MSKWKSNFDGYREAVAYIAGRHKGEITSFELPWPSLNDALVGGFEWHTTNIIGARPGTGKTLFKDQLIREGFIKNKDPFNVLEFQLEMPARTMAMREFSNLIGLSYKQLCSASNDVYAPNITAQDFEKCKAVMNREIHPPHHIVEDAPTVDELEKTVEEYMEQYSGKDSSGRLQYTNTIVTLDHTILVRYGKEGRTEMLYRLGETLTKLKKKFPICFIIVSQLNREVDQLLRCEPGKAGNYIKDSDIFGADAMLQHADTLIALDRPAKRNLNPYGPNRYIIDNKDMIFLFLLKNRAGDTGLMHFMAKYETMEMVESAEPQIKQKNK